MPENKSLIQDFKDFIASGDLILIAIAFIMAGLIKDVVDKFIEGIMNPIVGAIFGKPDFSSVGFDLGDSRVSVGLVINALITLVITGAVLFAIYKWYQKQQASKGVVVPPPAGTSDNDLLKEIRDLLKAR